MGTTTNCIVKECTSSTQCKWFEDCSDQRCKERTKPDTIISGSITATHISEMDAIESSSTNVNTEDVDSTTLSGPSHDKEIKSTSTSETTKKGVIELTTSSKAFDGVEIDSASSSGIVTEDTTVLTSFSGANDEEIISTTSSKSYMLESTTTNKDTNVNAFNYYGRFNGDFFKKNHKQCDGQ